MLENDDFRFFSNVRNSIRKTTMGTGIHQSEENDNAVVYYKHNDIKSFTVINEVRRKNILT